MSSENSKKQDPWSSLLSELGVEDSQQKGEPVQVNTSEQPREFPRPVPEEPVVSAPGSPSENSSPGKTARFGSGIIPEPGPAPGSGRSKSGSSRKGSKMSFFDRLASINLFGAGSPERIDKSAGVPGDPAILSNPISAESLEPKKLEKVQKENQTGNSDEEKISKARNQPAPPPGTKDPWMNLASQLGVQIEEKRKEEERKAVVAGSSEIGFSEREPEGSSRFESAPSSREIGIAVKVSEISTPEKAPEEEIPDIESLVSFRHLPSRKKDPKTFPTVSPPATPSRDPERSRDVPPERRSRGSATPRGSAVQSERDTRSQSLEDSKRENGRSGRSRNENRGSEEPDSSSRNRRTRDRRPGKSLEITPVYDERMELEDLDLVAPNPRESDLPIYTLEGIEEEDLPIVPKKSRHKRGSSRKTKESFSAYDSAEEDFDGEMEAEYEVLVPPAPREYGPSRDVFADLLPYGEEEEDERRKSRSRQKPHSERERGKPARGSRTRESADSRTREDIPVDSNIFEEEEIFDPREEFSQRKPARSSRSERPERSGGQRRPSAPVEDFDDERTADSSRHRGSKGSGSATSRRTRSPEFDPAEERDEQEELEMIQLHKSIPSWEDAVLPIIESNVAKHATRRDSGGRNRGRRS